MRFAWRKVYCESLALTFAKCITLLNSPLACDSALAYGLGRSHAARSGAAGLRALMTRTARIGSGLGF